MSLLTRRIPTILGIAFLVGLLVAGYYYLTGQSTPVESGIVPAKVVITNIADNKFSVSWVTQSSTQGAVEWGVVGGTLNSVAHDDRNKSGSSSYVTHHVSIEGLQPSTQYAFRILSGPEQVKFDNNGSPYTTATGPVIGGTPPSVNFYGMANTPSGGAASGTLVYLTLPGAATASTIVNDSGNYALTLSTIRTSNLRDYVEYDPSASVATLTLESGQLQSVASVSLANSAPVPTITLGQNVDFMNLAETPAVAEVVPEASPQSTSSPTTPTILNVEPLEEAEINQVSSTSVTLLNPKEEGELIKTLRPEFRGTGPADTALAIALTGQKSISDTTTIDSDGTWSWAPVIDLLPGSQKITVSYTAASGASAKIERGFVASSSTSGLDPAFVSSPSASTASVLASASPSSMATSSATPRAAMPATDSGVPVTGVITNTLLTGALGIVILVIGAVLLAL